MNMEQFLRKIPKTEIHCHIGTPPPLLVELAARNHIDLPPYQEPEELYQNITYLE